MFIVCKERENGALIAGTPPNVLATYEAAKAEAERLAATVTDAKAFVVFRAYSRSTRALSPVETRLI